MSALITLFAILFAMQNPVIPFLDSEDFTYEVDYFLKRKAPQNKQIYDTNAPPPGANADVLPYVKIHFTLREFEADDARIQVYHGQRRLNTKKISGPMKLTLDMGYAVDMKEGVQAPTFEIFILNTDRKRRARILVEVKENGELLINGIQSGMI